MNQQIDPAVVVAAIGDAVIVSDAKGDVIVWNPAAERLFGWTAAEALGQSMEMIIPQRLRKRHWEGYDKSMQTGQTRTGTTCCACRRWTRPAARCRSPSRCSCSSGRTARSAPAGSVIRDETERFTQERALRKRVAELEARLAAGASAS